MIKRASSNNGGRHIVGLNLNMQCNWSNEHGDIVCEYKDIGHMELALPNFKNGSFYECVMQRFYEDNPNSHLFHDLGRQDVYDGQTFIIIL